MQLRPTVTPLGAAYEYDVFLFERMYAQSEMNDIRKIILNTQYRIHPQIAIFPSRRFYGEKLLSDIRTENRKLTEILFN